MAETKDFRKSFTIVKLREYALQYDSYPDNPEKNLVGNVAIRDFLKWIEQNKTIVAKE